ncbi:hypothetical protein D9M71_829660 [compost metagenome]
MQAIFQETFNQEGTCEACQSENEQHQRQHGNADVRDRFQKRAQVGEQHELAHEKDADRRHAQRDR